MQITFHGAAENVTGSKHLIETVDNKRILLDCGFHQGHRKEAEKLNKTLPFDAKSVDAVILSHAHLDHCGLLPLLIRNGYQGRIFATPATIDVAYHMLEDSADIQEGDAEYLNRHLDPGEEPHKPLYTLADAEKTMEQFSPIPYASMGEEWTEIIPGVSLKFYDAGHILGSAVSVVRFKENDVTRHVGFTGDLGKNNAPILRDPQPIQEPLDAMLTETTYGDRIHERIQDAAHTIREVIEYAIKRKSKIIVPAFALGRTQEFLYILHKLFDSAGFPRVPVYLDSPLAIKVTEVFKKNRNVYDAQSKKDFDFSKDFPLVFGSLSYSRTRNDSMQLNGKDGPMIIISASGMMEAGRVVHHLKHTISDPDNVIMITGYQAANTLGRRIQEGVSPVHIFKRAYDVRARVLTIPSLSAHADQRELLEYLDEIPRMSNVFLVHGEGEAMQTFAGLLSTEHIDTGVFVPKRGETFSI